MNDLSKIRNAYVLLKKETSNIFKNILINNQNKFFKAYWAYEKEWRYAIATLEAQVKWYKWQGFEKVPFSMVSNDKYPDRIIATGRVFDNTSTTTTPTTKNVADMKTDTKNLETKNLENNLKYDYYSNSLVGATTIKEAKAEALLAAKGEMLLNKRYIEVQYIPFGQKETAQMNNLFAFSPNNNNLFRQMYVPNGWVVPYGIGDKTDFVNIRRVLNKEKVTINGSTFSVNTQANNKTFYMEVFGTKNKDFAEYTKVVNMPNLEDLSTIDKDFFVVEFYYILNNGKNPTSFYNNNVRNLSIAIKNSFYKYPGQDQYSYYNYDFDWQGNLIINQLYGTPEDTFWIPEDDIKEFITEDGRVVAPENSDDDSDEDGGDEQPKEQKASLWILGIGAALLLGGMLLGKKKSNTTINNYH